MNRVRRAGDIYQVLLTPHIKISPDSALIIGNWEDEDLRNYDVLEFNSLNDAQYEALKYPDIDWHRIIVNHEHIFHRLHSKLVNILDKYSINIDAHLMTSEEFKNNIFDRVLNNGERFNLKYMFNDIISFTITNPWSSNLHKISKTIENHRDHYFLDNLRIREKKIIDSQIIYLYGYTEFGTVYVIRLVTSLIHQWIKWMNKYSYKTDGQKLYKQLSERQKVIDKGPILL